VLNSDITAELGGDRGTGQNDCVAHHLFTEAGERRWMVAFLRYHDTFVKREGGWKSAERELSVDWTETRPSLP
jgi:SnoaL-like protein